MIRKPKLSGDGLPSSERATLTNELLMELIDEIKSIKAIFTPDNIILPEPKLEIVKPEPKIEKVVELPKVILPEKLSKAIIITPKKRSRRGKKNDK